jgi:histidyl-tRNA synthetase
MKLPKGTTDYFPEEVKKRMYIIKKIKKKFEYYGFYPLETPSFEELSIIKGYSGEEGDKLIFKILKLGNFSKIKSLFKENNNKSLISLLSDKALRYDLTVPLARFITMHNKKIFFPFKRYQIQTVWRGDNPQQGRLREFYQCDADIIGNSSIHHEIELIMLYDSIFNSLNIPILININNINLLYKLFNKLKINSYWKAFIRILDKWDKIGFNKVFQEFVKTGIPLRIIKKIDFIFNNENSEKKIYKYYKIFSDEKEKQYINDIKFLILNLKKIGLKNSELFFNTRLVRGLNYYTGIIFEVFTPYFRNAIGGGGRYDCLTSIFGLKPAIPGIGISLGLDRILFIMNKFNLFDKLTNIIPILFINFGNYESIFAIHYINMLRINGIASELYPIPIRIKKQLQYANNRKLQYVAIIGKKEIKKNIICIKDLKTGIETYHNIISLINKLK